MTAATTSTRRLASTLTNHLTQQSRLPPPPVPSTSSLPRPKPRTPRNAFHFPSPNLHFHDEEVMYKPVFSMHPASPVRLPNGEPRVFLKKSVKLHTGLEWQQQAEGRITNPPAPKPLSMVAPLVFDGPAKPWRVNLQDDYYYHQMRNAIHTPSPASPSVGRPHLPPPSKASTPSISTPASYRTAHSQGVVKVFDGPARLSRYHHRSPPKDEKVHQRPSKRSTLIMLAGGGGAAAVAGLLGQIEVWS